jgi:hypothetical protein
MVARIRSYVSRALPALAPNPVSVRLCHTTKLDTDKDAFVVWTHNRVVAIAGNNLFKFAPDLGRLLAEAAVSDKTPAGAAPSLQAHPRRPKVRRAHAGGSQTRKTPAATVTQPSRPQSPRTYLLHSGVFCAPTGLVFKTRRPEQPSGWMVRFHRRSA